MNRNQPLYSTNASLFTDAATATVNDDVITTVIRPPIRDAYDTKKKFDEAVQMGIEYARNHKIPYIDHY